MKPQEPQVFAFAQIDGPNAPEARQLVYQEIQQGRSRFGMWDQSGSLKEVHYGKNAALLGIKPGDWIVHINMPSYGNCVAVQAAGEYEFDEGLACPWGSDFHNVIPNLPSSIVEFGRRDVNVLPSVNLSPRKRLQRVLQVADFLQSIGNLRSRKFDSVKTESSNLIHLKDRVGGLLPDITRAIHEMSKSKQFERLLHEVFQRMPLVRSVQNGFGWKTDHGADLILECDHPVLGEEMRTRLVVQAKSFTGDHHDLNGVDQLVEAINKYEADAGMLITTANSTPKLLSYIEAQSEAVKKPIHIIAGDDVARFIMRNASTLLVG
jgi:hypothetical protein